MPKPERRELIDALTRAVQGEQRFGARDDVRPELDARWERVIDLIEKLWPQNRKK